MVVVILLEMYICTGYILDYDFSVCTCTVSDLFVLQTGPIFELLDFSSQLPCLF